MHIESMVQFGERIEELFMKGWTPDYTEEEALETLAAVRQRKTEEIEGLEAKKSKYRRADKIEELDILIGELKADVQMLNLVMSDMEGSESEYEGIDEEALEETLAKERPLCYSRHLEGLSKEDAEAESRASRICQEHLRHTLIEVGKDIGELMLESNPKALLEDPYIMSVLGVLVYCDQDLFDRCLQDSDDDKKKSKKSKKSKKKSKKGKKKSKKGKD